MQLRSEAKRSATPSGAAGGEGAELPSKKPRTDDEAGEAEASRDENGEAAETEAAADTGSDSSSEEDAEEPQPSRLLHDCTAEPACVPLNVALSMSHEEYLELRELPRYCNVQLKACSTTSEVPADCSRFPATLPATEKADAAVLSAVLKARISSWEAGARTDGITVLELQVGVQQELVDDVIKGVYARQLLIGPKTAESLLLLADYLQLGWLTLAVARYLKYRVLKDYPLALGQLSQRFPGLDLFKAVVTRALERLQPQELAELLKLLPTNDRLPIFRGMARKGPPVQCLEFIHLAESVPEEESKAEWHELHMVTSRHPELALALMDCNGQDGDINYSSVWRLHYELNAESVLSKQRSRPLLVWLVPLEKLRKKISCKAPAILQLSDGRRFSAYAEQKRREPGAPALMGLYARPCDDSVWHEGDRLVFTAVKTTVQAPGQAQSAKARYRSEKTEGAVGTRRSRGFSTLFSKWVATEEHIICDHLPVMLEILPAKS